MLPLTQQNLRQRILFTKYNIYEWFKFPLRLNFDSLHAIPPVTCWIHCRQKLLPGGKTRWIYWLDTVLVHEHALIQTQLLYVQEYRELRSPSAIFRVFFISLKSQETQ